MLKKCINIVCVLSHTQLSLTPWTPLSKEFPRQEYWSKWPFSSPEYLPDLRMGLTYPALAGEFLTSESVGKLEKKKKKKYYPYPCCYSWIKALLHRKIFFIHFLKFWLYFDLHYSKFKVKFWFREWWIKIRFYVISLCNSHLTWWC